MLTLKRCLKKNLAEAIHEARTKHPGKRIDVYFQDEARFGLIGTLSRVWAERGSRPFRYRQTRYEWVYVFGCVCPETADVHACLMPLVNTEVMNLYLENFSEHMAKDVHAVLVLDCAGWHCAKGLCVPENMTLLHLPAYSPELNPMELPWREMRQKKLSNRIITDVADLDDAVSKAWLEITSSREAIRNLCLFPWIASVVHKSN